MLSITDSLYIRGRGVVAVAHGPGAGLGKGAVLEQRRAGASLRQFAVHAVEYFTDGYGHNWTENWGIVINPSAISVEDLLVGDTLKVVVPAVPDVIPPPRLKGSEPLGM